MKYLDTVCAEFESAHLLPFHKGKCANLHGHSYKCICRFYCEVDENGQYKSEFDFSSLKKKVRDVVEPFDHAIIFSSYNLQSKAESQLLSWAQAFNMRYVILPDTYSTSEGIAKYIKHNTEADIVIVQETSTNTTTLEGD